MGIAFSLAAALTTLLGWACMRLALRYRFVDRPGHRKIHKRPVPFLGGLAFFLGLGLAVAILCIYGNPNCQAIHTPAAFTARLLPAVLACLVGLTDDLFGLRARYKFLAQGLFALAFSYFACRFSTLHIPGLAPIALDPMVAVGMTTFFIVAVVNGFNMIDGSDGLCLVSSMVSLGFIAVAAQWQMQPHLSVLAMAACGAAAGILVWNRPPARMYLGDAGSQGLGFLIACMVVALGKRPEGLSAGQIPPGWQPFDYQFVIALLLVGKPAMEVFLTVARRGLQGRSLGRADQGHIHHRLARLGMGPLRIALVALVINLLFGGIALAFLANTKGLAVLLSTLLAGLLGTGLQRLGYMRFLQRDWVFDRRPHFAVASHFAAMQGAKLQLAQNREEVLALVTQACHEFGAHECRISLRDEDHRFAWAWKEQVPQQLKAKAWDRFRIPNTRNHASWSMDNDEREPELTMNLRVIMTEFMHKTMERLVQLMNEQPKTLPVPEYASRAHQDLVLSIKGFKRRL
jgi:UDP-GlcNAc:undecaprenyl-phosphate GlcNAc-1-phosphate transferase